MGKSKLILYSQDDIANKAEIIRHNNTFINPEGSFYLAKGYTGCNPALQLESSALTIFRNEIGFDIKKADCETYFQKVNENYYKSTNIQTKRLYYLRSMLVHYYGYTLFCRTEIIKNYNDRNQFSDCSLVPNPIYYGKEATESQIATLMKLFELNDDGTFAFDRWEPSNQVIFQKILAHDKLHTSWHR